MTKLERFLEEKGIADIFEENFKKAHIHRSYQDHLSSVGDSADAIASSFYWEATPQKTDYWDAIHQEFFIKFFDKN